MDKHNVCSVTSEPSQSSSRRVSSFKESSVEVRKVSAHLLWRGTEFLKVV